MAMTLAWAIQINSVPEFWDSIYEYLYKMKATILMSEFTAKSAGDLFK